MIVHVTDQDLITRMWPTLELLFARVTPSTNGCYEPIDVLDDIRAGRQQLWVDWDAESKIVNAAMTTTIVDRPRKRVLVVPFITGDKMRHWRKEFSECLDAFAKREGCGLIEGYYREGWERMWPGSRRHGVVLVKEITQ